MKQPVWIKTDLAPSAYQRFAGSKEVHHGMFLLLASERVTHELQLRATRNLL
jgi:hypothetical protein